MKKPPQIDFQLRPTACIWGALVLLVLPLRWIFAAVAAAVFHELCHYGALRLCGVGIGRITVGSGGAVMETEGMQAGKELICALAGPAGSLLLVLFAKWMPLMALCGFVQGIYNLLPLFPFDGGRVLNCSLELVKAPNRARIMTWVERVLILLMLGLGFYGWTVLRLGFWAFGAALVLVQKTIQRKIPCKHGPHWVQ